MRIIFDLLLVQVLNDHFSISGSEFRKAMGQPPKNRLNSLKAQDLFSPDGTGPSSPSNVNAFDYSGVQLPKPIPSGTKNRHRSKSHSDDLLRRQVKSFN